LSEKVGHAVVPLDTHGIYVEGNMASISPTVTIDISCIPGKIENVYINEDCSPEEIQIYIELFKELCDVFAWSYEETPGIDPRALSNVRLKPTRMLNLFSKDLEPLILGRPLLLKQRWKNCLMHVSSTQFP
jgi:hypothetical protein